MIERTPVAAAMEMYEAVKNWVVGDPTTSAAR